MTLISKPIPNKYGGRHLLVCRYLGGLNINDLPRPLYLYLYLYSNPANSADLLLLVSLPLVTLRWFQITQSMECLQFASVFLQKY